MSASYILYGAQVSYYTGKVRAYLRKKGLPFNEVAATLKTYRDIIVPHTGVQYMPVLQTPDNEYLQDTSIIIEALEARHPEHPALPTTPKQRLVAELLEVYADEWLVLPAMHYRWNFPKQNQPFIYQEFGRIALPWAPAPVRGWLGARLGARFRKSVVSLGVTERTIPAIEKSYLALLDELQAHFEQLPFLLGSKPCIADFGFIGPLYAHLYRDPMPGALMRQRAPAVVDWVERMLSPEPHLQQGEWLGDDQIPTTLEPILQRMASEQYPVLLATDTALYEWREKNSPTVEPSNTSQPEAVKRFIGTHEFCVEGVCDQRVVIPYSLWMLQRVLEGNHVAALAQSNTATAWLAGLGFAGLLEFKVSTPMQRLHNRLYFRDSVA